MELVFCLTLLLLASFSRGREMGMLRDEERENDEIVNNDDAIAFESFGSPVYGPNNIKSGGPNGKSAYNPPAPALPASYAAYLASLGLANPYAYGPYNRFNVLPYTLPSTYGYGASLLSNPAYASALLSGLGYSGYGSPYFGRTAAYPGLGYGYLSGLGYRYGGLGYLPEALRSGPAPVAGVPAPVAGVPAPQLAGTVPRAATSSLPAPFSAIPNGIARVPASGPALLPYRAALRPIRGKDGVIGYGYAPDGQNVPVY